MIFRPLLLAVLLAPVCLRAENVMEMRYVLPQKEALATQAEVDGRLVWLSADVVVSDADVVEAKTARQQHEQIVIIKLTPAAAARFDAYAAKNLNERLAIVARGKVTSAPMIRAAEFGGTLWVSGNLNPESAAEVAAALPPKAQTKP